MGMVRYEQEGLASAYEFEILEPSDVKLAEGDRKNLDDRSEDKLQQERKHEIKLSCGKAYSLALGENIRFCHT